MTDQPTPSNTEPTNAQLLERLRRAASMCRINGTVPTAEAYELIAARLAEAERDRERVNLMESLSEQGSAWWGVTEDGSMRLFCNNRTVDAPDLRQCLDEYAAMQAKEASGE